MPGTFSPARLHDARQWAGLTRNELASAVGRTPKQVERWETGTAVPPESTIFAIARALSVKPAQLMDTQ